MIKSRSRHSDSLLALKCPFRKMTSISKNVNVEGGRAFDSYALRNSAMREGMYVKCEK
jgi:hypothetical protein